MPADMKPTLSGARRLAEDQGAARPIALRTIHDASHASTHAPVSATANSPELSVNVTAAIIAITNDAPMVLTTAVSGLDSLPSSRFLPARQLSLDACLRAGVAEHTGLHLGYAEQLIAFADPTNGLGIGYLALTRTAGAAPAGAAWRSWYDYLPWEDWRQGRPQLLSAHLEPRLRSWASEAVAAQAGVHGLTRAERARMAFGFDRAPWNEERVAERFELLCEAGLIGSIDVPGRGMRLDHTRMLANAIGRLRAKLKSRPVIFELMAPEFTLFELQKTVEAILGPHLHKQNFRRLVESAGLVEPTGEVRSKTGGRPAKLFRFRSEVLMERPAPGVRVHAQHG